MTERSYRGLLWGLALLGTVLDQISKYSVFKWLYEPHRLADGRLAYDGEREVVPGAFRLLAQFGGRDEAPTGLLKSLRACGTSVLPKVNHGALFGLGGEYDTVAVFGRLHIGANAVFAAISIAAALAIVYWSTRRTTARDFALCAALGLILAGTLGNLYDRVVFNGVRDFLYFYWIEWPVFNVADCCLVCGAFLLLAQAFWTRSVPVESAASEVGRSSQMANAS
ncbi:MAG TPA: signal peptidase II [Gemmataceae bacterium]|nr:signal peptidase II [Gemmataceae bacterium]